MLIGLSTVLLAQNNQEIYLNGKSFFRQGNYALAKQNFEKLMSTAEPTAFAPYATFYYGLSAWKLEEYSLAKDSWRQLEARYSDWGQMAEVYHWLSKAYLQLQNYDEAINYWQKIEVEEVRAETDTLMMVNLPDTLQEQRYAAWYEQYPDNQIIAKKYVERLKVGDLTLTNNEIITGINQKFDFTPEMVSVMKDQYKVAVLLPFMYESLEDTRIITRNTFVMDLYQGMTLAADSLNAAGIDIQLFPYDTRRSGSATAKILERDEMKGMDLIIGPLYPEPFELVNKFSQIHAINMLNPVSGNSQVVMNNPFSYLFKPSYETMAENAAKYAAKHFAEDKDYFIIYEDNDRFATMAEAYQKSLEADSFKVAKVFKISEEKNREVLDALTSFYEVKLTLEERDSIMEIPGRLVKSRELFNQEDTIQYYEERFYLDRDSIGHIFVASTSTIVAANTVGGIEVRGDSIPIIGMGEWLNFNVLTLDQFERLEILLMHPNYINYDNESHTVISEKITKTYRNKPTLNQFIGYECMWFAGQMLNEYGTYYQLGLRNGAFIPGQVFLGFLYGFAQDNQVMPLVKLIDSSLENVNEIYEENE